MSCNARPEWLMLLALTIRDIVIIDRLEVEFRPGLCVLTGETGTGKSILLDALGLCLGDRAQSALVRLKSERGQATAEFVVAADHPALELLAEQGLEADDRVLLRRVISADGRSRAFINDQPVSGALLRRVGATLVEIQGQHEAMGLLDTASHRRILDMYAGADLTEIAAAWQTLRLARETLTAAEEALASARDDEDYTRHVLDELTSLDPQPGEEAELTSRQSLLKHGAQIAGAVDDALQALVGEGGAAGRLRSAERGLERVAERAAGRLDESLEGLGRAAVETAEATAVLESAARELDADPAQLADLEDRLHGLRTTARKHRVTVDELPALAAEFAARLAAIDGGESEIERLRQAAATAFDVYGRAAERLSESRRRAAARLDAAVAAELGPLKLERATFATALERLDETAWGPEGSDRIGFEVSTNPGQPPGPISRIASGGELSRFLLALKVALAGVRSAPTLIFDEIDRGVGGATADAIGARLARLAENLQVLVVTHSPQVAARGGHHWRVGKQSNGEQAVATLDELDAAARREELARMLAGAEVTDEARAAAQSLMTSE